MPLDESKIIEAAAKAGFDSELKVAAIASGRSWSTQQNLYYIDKDEKKGRELDFEIYRILNADGTPHLSSQVFLCVEVKKTAEPFIFFSNEPQTFEPGSAFGLLHWKQNLSGKILSYKDVERFRPFAKPKRIARSYIAFKDGKSQQIKSGVLSAVKAAKNFAEECNEAWDDKSWDICFFIPMVVVDGPLYECFFESGSDKLTANQVEDLVYLQNYVSEGYGDFSALVSVVTLATFSECLARYETWAEHMLGVMVEARDKLSRDAK
jgi:hypothetical protein